MHSFKIGDKVRRTTRVPNWIHDRTGVQQGVVYTVRSVSSSGAYIGLAESKEITFKFDYAAFAPEAPSATWDVNEALRLRDLAVQAIQDYNTYLLQQPLLEAIDIPPIK